MGTDFSLMRRHFEIVSQQGYVFVPTVYQTRHQVMVCFDDGWLGIYDHKEELIKKHILPTVFIAVDLIGKEGYLSIDHIKELESLGFRFMAHTWSHQDLTTFDDHGLKQELRDSKEWLEKQFEHPFDSIRFPMGRFSKEVIDKCFEYGFKQLYSSLPGGYYDMQGDGLICRNCAQNMSPCEFLWMLNGRSLLFKYKLINQHVVK